MPGLGRQYEAGQSPAWWQGPHGPPLERGCESQDVVMPTATNTYTTPVPADMRNAGIRQQNHPRQGCGSTEWPLELAPAQSMRRTGFRWSLAAKRQSHGYRSPAQSPAPPPHRWRLPPVRDRSVGRADAARCIGEERERRRKPRVPRPRALPMFAGQSRAVVHAKRRATTTSVYTCNHFPARLSPRAIIWTLGDRAELRRLYEVLVRTGRRRTTLTLVFRPRSRTAVGMFGRSGQSQDA